MPYRTVPLCVQVQRHCWTENICLWAEVDTDQPMMNFPVAIVGTGHGRNPNVSIYVGTVQQEDLVWHIYMGVPTAS